MGTNTIIQGAVPSILRDTPQKFFNEVISSVTINAHIAYSVLSNIPGLKPVMPSGAMYMMVGIDTSLFNGFRHDMEFVEKLVGEQSVMCLPGMCFDYPNYIRLVLTVPEEDLREACSRIAQFCQKHSRFTFSEDESPLQIISDGPEPLTGSGVAESPVAIRV